MHATNSLGDASLGTALHTHGMFFNGSNWADGAVSTTQCPIPLNQTLSYVIDTSLQVRQKSFLSAQAGPMKDGEGSAEAFC